MVRSVCINRPVTQRLHCDVVKVLAQRINYSVGNSKARYVPPFNFGLRMQCAEMDDVRFATFTAFIALGAKSDVRNKILVIVRSKNGFKSFTSMASSYHIVLKMDVNCKFNCFCLRLMTP